MGRYLSESQNHVDDVIKTRETSILINPFLQSKAICVLNISAKFQD